VVIVTPGRKAANGDMVVAWLKAEEEATLKKFYLEGGVVRLQPANRQMEPIYSPAENVEIHGKVVQIIRKLG
jgi:repressor LexA